MQRDKIKGINFIECIIKTYCLNVQQQLHDMFRRIKPGNEAVAT